MRLIFPYPVSANRYWQSFVPKGWTRAIVHPSSEAKAYKQEVGLRAKVQGWKSPTTKPIRLRIVLCPRTKKDGSASATVLDLSNCMKVAEDALQGIVYEDDKQVRSIALDYGDAIPEGALVVEVDEFVPPPMGLFAMPEKKAPAEVPF